MNSYSASLHTLASLDCWAEVENRGSLTVFQSARWLHLWEQTLGAAASLQLLVVRVDDAQNRTVMLWPLVRRWRNGLRVIEGIDHGVSDYHAPLLLPDFAAHDAAKIVKTAVQALPRADLLCLTKLPASLGDNLPNPLLTLPHVPMRISAHATRIGADWLTFYAKTASPSQRKAMRRNRRRLEEHGRIEFVVATTPEQQETLLAALIEQKRRRCHEKGWRDSFADPAIQAFYRGLAASPMGHLSALCLNGRPLAVHLGAIHHGRFHYLIPGFEAGAWQRFSCGRLLLEAAMEWSATHGCPVFDFTIGDHDYKSHWNTEATALAEILIGLSWRGRIAAGALRLRRWIGRWRRRYALKAVRLASLPKQSKPSPSQCAH